MKEKYFAFYRYGQIFVEVPLRLTENPVKNQEVTNLARRAQNFFDKMGFSDYFKVYAISTQTRKDFSYEMKASPNYYGIPTICTLSEMDPDYVMEGEILAKNPQIMPQITVGSLDQILKWAKPIIKNENEFMSDTTDMQPDAQLLDADIRRITPRGKILPN
ncbi:hypothetical protein HYX06_00005 [Candidatus Woesearchaeota archaeon]|nr:hypothetical protein [Candidatus Woesearchaeota archaeon]